MTNTSTNTTTYTVVDIRKTFEGFDADLRTIALRTGKKSSDEVEKYIHDVLEWAENKYITYVDIVLIDKLNTPVRAKRFTVDENGKTTVSDRAGKNDWPDIPDTSLWVIVVNNAKWVGLSVEERIKFCKEHSFKLNWGPSGIDNSYSHLSKEGAQLYARNGYELKSENFK